jgi:hypothetical protein
MKITIFILLPFLACCQPKTTLEFTDKYIKVVNSGQQFGLHELASKVVDSVLGYPNVKDYKNSFTIVLRSTKKRPPQNAKIKMYFNVKNSNYLWKVSNDSSLTDYYYLDTISLKQSTWYYLVTERNRFNIYFYLVKPGEYIVKEESNVNLGPW